MNNVGESGRWVVERGFFFVASESFEWFRTFGHLYSNDSSQSFILSFIFHFLTHFYFIPTLGKWFTTGKYLLRFRLGSASRFIDG